MDTTSWVESVFRLCSRYVLLRPIHILLRFLYPLIIAHSETARVVEKISRDPGLPCTNPTSSAWQIPPHLELSTTQSSKLPEKAEVLIIGSGITAASIAHHLLTSDSSISVVIAEARTLCSGATGRNGGHILELPYEEYDLEVALLGRDAAKRLIQFRLDHLGEILSFVKTDLEDDAAKKSEARLVDVVDACFDPQHWTDSKAQLGRFLEAFPEQVGRWKIWEGDDARKKFGMAHICGAISGPAGAIWPYRFITSIFEMLKPNFPDRLKIETDTPVLEISTTTTESEYPYLVRTSRGTIQARNIVHATNGHVAHLLPRLRGKIFPIRGQMTVQSLTGENTPPNLGNERSWLLRYSKGYDYLTQNPETGDLFLGGGALQGGLDDIGNPADDQQSFLALAHLSGALPRMFERNSGQSSLSSVLKSSWTGTLGFSCDGRPWVGGLPSKISGKQPRFLKGLDGGEWIAAGFCGSGMVYCWKSGRALADMILGRDVSWLPESLLPTETRFHACAAEDMATYWLELSIR